MVFPCMKALGTAPREETEIGCDLEEGNWLHYQIASSHPDEHLDVISTGQQFLGAFVG